eukprot:265702-Pyramimonas_sp.AAC.1
MPEPRLPCGPDNNDSGIIKFGGLAGIINDFPAKVMSVRSHDDGDDDDAADDDGDDDGDPGRSCRLILQILAQDWLEKSRGSWLQLACAIG